MDQVRCILCDKHARREALGFPDEFRYVCKNCGTFRVSSGFESRNEDIHSKINMPLLSGYVREQNELGNKDVFISNDNVFNLLNSSMIPQRIAQKIDKFILFLERRTRFLSDHVFHFSHFRIAGELSSEDEIYDMDNPFAEPIQLRDVPAIAYATNIDELVAIIEHCVKEGYVDNPLDAFGFSLTVSGIEYAQSLKRKVSESNTAFVAMWFDPDGDMRRVYDEAIKPAIESERCGSFRAFRVDDHEFNGDVMDEIIAEIKRCRFVVADLTGNRGGVYYEAGYGMGLGKEVILTCRKKEFDGDSEHERVHFDVNHRKIIVWETQEELKEKLIQRIRATIE